MTDVFRVGQQVRNPETWKNAGTTFATVTGFLGIVFAVLASKGYIDGYTKEDLEIWAGGLITAGSIFHIIWTKITSKKVGVPGLDKAEPVKVVVENDPVPAIEVKEELKASEKSGVLHG